MSHHLYWCAGTSQGADGDVILAKWLSLINHMQNVHTGHGDLFPECQHGEIHTDAGRRKKWLKPFNNLLK